VTAEFKLGDKVIATTPFLGEKKDRDGLIKDVQANRYGVGFSYRVEVVVAGDTTSYWLTADKLRLAQTPTIQVIRSNIGEQPIVASTTVTAGFNEGDPLVVVNATEFSGECVSPLSQIVEPPAIDDFDGVPIPQVEYLTFPEIEALAKGQLSESDMSQLAQVVDPPKKRIRRSNEEQALGIPLDQILAYRANPEGWIKKEREATDSFHEVIEQAVESHWQDKADEILVPEDETLQKLGEELNPSQESPLDILIRLGWIEKDDSDGYFHDNAEIHPHGDGFIKYVVSLGADNTPLTETYIWDGEDFEAWVTLDPNDYPFRNFGGADEANDDKPAADVSVLETTDPELMPQMEIDSLKPEVYNYEVMGEVPDGYVLARERFNGIRWYVMYFKKAKKLAYLPGTTSVDDNTSQPPAYLTKWRYDMVARYGSVDAMEGFVDDTAAYGTIMHTLIAWYINGSLPVIGSQSWKDQVCMLITLQDGRIPDIYYPLWDRKLRKDLTCWNQFMIDRNVKVHLMEFACGSTDLGVAGQIDLVCTMDFNRARVNAILDMKSGKKSTGQGNTKATQLGIYKLLFDRVFPDWKYGDTGKSPMGITKFFNWHPNDYSEVPSKDTGLVVPTYELVNQTDSVDWKEIDLQMKLFKHRTQGVKPGSNARFSIEGELKPFTDNQALIKGGLRQDTYIEKYGLEVCDD